MNILAAFRRWYWQDLPDAAQAKMLREVRQFESRRYLYTDKDGAVRRGYYHTLKYETREPLWKYETREPLWNPTRGKWT